MKYFLAVLFVVVVFSATAQNPSTAPLSGGTPKAFTLSSDQTGVLESSLNLFTGDVQFPIQLVNLPGRNGMDVDVSIHYNSNVHPVANTWNAEAPTGVAGLGWSFDFPRIIVDNKMTGTREDDTYYVVDGGGPNKLVYAGSASASEKLYKSKSFTFWIIKYFPNDEKWEITKEDGTKFTYGDKTSNRSTVQWVVHLNNWIGSSNLVTSTIQKQQAQVWNLSEIRSTWNDVIKYTYLNVDEKVGTSSGKEHTEASYLSVIESVTGKRVEFAYAEKLAGEYVEPHTENGSNVIDAYQERFETKYLDYISVKDESSILQYKVDLGYSTLGTGDLTKRLLSSVTQINAQGLAFPGYQFSYITTYSADTNYGALLSVTTPTKGTINFEYAKETLTRAMREKKISSISATPSYREAKAWIGSDYVVIARRQQSSTEQHVATGRNVIIQAFVWDGEWIEWNLTETLPNLALVKDDGTSASLTDMLFQYYNMLFTLQKDFFAIYYRSEGVGYNTLKIYRKDENARGRWIKYEENITTSSTPLKLYFDLVSGENFICTTGTYSDLRIYTWNGTTWTQFYIERPDKQHDHLAAGLNYIISFTRNTDLLTFYFLNEDGTWVTKTAPAFGTTTTSIDGYWYPAASFVVAMVPGNPEYFITWDESYTLQVQSSSLSMPDNSYVDIIDNAMVGFLTTDATPISYAARFNGQNWYVTPSMDFGGLTTWRLSQCYGTDFVIRPKSSSTAHGLKYFNPNTNTWTDLTFNTSNKDMMMAGHNFFVAVDPTVNTKVNLFMRTPNGSFTQDPNSFTSTTGFIAGENRYPWQSGYSYVIKSIHDYSSPVGLVAIGFKNGKLDSDPLKMDFTRLGSFNTDNPAMDAISYYDPTRTMAAGNIIVGFVGTFGQENATELKLYNLIEGQAAGAITDFRVKKVSVNTGEHITYSTIYADVATATVDAAGTTAQYNAVTVYPGGDQVLPTYGKKEYFFFNGIDGTAAGNFPTPPAGVDYNLNLKRLNEALYRTKVWKKGSPDVLISEEATSNNIYASDIQVSSVTRDKGYYVRNYATESYQDGIKVYKVTGINSANGLPSQLTTYNRVGSTDSNPVVINIKYAYELYSIMAAKNMRSQVAQVKETSNGIVQETRVTRYLNWNAANADMYDEFRWSYSGSSDFTAWTTTPSADWQLVNRVTVRDVTTGVVLEKEGFGDRKSAIIWDQYKRNPVAQIANAGSSDTGFASFEDTSTGGLTYTGNNVVTTGDSKTGSKYLLLGSAGIIKSGLTSSTTYTISFWAKTNASSTVSVTGQSSVVVDTGGEWKFFKFSATGNTSITIAKTGTNDVMIDEVRVHPASARMETYTYDPLFGKTSETAADNRTLYTEYDEFGRVRSILDQNKDVVKTIKYKIKQ